MIRSTPRLTAALAVALLAAGACKHVPHQPAIAALVGTVDGARLRAHIQALDAIGPRPVSDAAATRATADYIAKRLRELGYEVREEPVELTLQGALFALVRPVGEPSAEPTEIELAPDLALGGNHAMQGQTERLEREGWQVESYVMRAREEARVCVVPNVIATRPGTREPERVLELSAHYDTVPTSPGASDNSSGVAALLEIARVAAEAPTHRTLRLCFFGAEEVGLLGSAAHVQLIRADPSSRVAGLINLDSVGFTAAVQREPDGVPWFLSIPDEGNFVVVAGKWSSGWLGNLVEGAADTYTPELAYYSANRIGSFFRDAGRSDHANYWSAGIAAVFLTDTGEFRSAHYHRASDTPETVDYAFLELITRAAAAAALHWAELEVDVPPG